MAQSPVKSVSSAILGYPRVGVNRELKRATEAFWKGNLPQEQLLQTAAELRRTHWQLQRDSGVDVIPSNDFSLYDQVLDMSALLGAVPPRYGWNGEMVDLDTYFAMARGVLEKQDLAGEKTIPAMEMTKWFDTNYHYIVPEFHRDATFRVSSTKVFDEFKEAQALGVTTRPVLVGPVSYLLLGKSKEAGFDALDLLERLLPVYAEVLKQLHSLGATSVQLDEPYLVMDLQDKAREAFRVAYRTLASSLSAMKLDLVVATYFGALDDNLELAASLPVAGLHVDLVRGAEQLQAVDRALPSDKLLSLGVVDGRNIWKADLTGIVTRLEPVLSQCARSRFHVAPSCSLLHTPFDLDLETVLDDEIKSWMSFAKQKLGEVVVLTRVLSRQGAAAELEANAACILSRHASARIHCSKVQQRVAAVKPADMQRKSSFTERQQLQHARLNLPLFPTTTIGSFPQTSDVRVQRAAFRKGETAADAYNDFIRSKISSVIQWQEGLDLDVLVHGEFERTDMVEYFGEQLRGFTFTKNGWVQSYGTRCVKPPVIYGDVSRPLPMTVEWAKYAQSCTSRPVKGMLTGPITILQWSFVRDDQPRSVTAHQIALAIRDEVLDLEAAGIAIIQIDEAALREGLPLRRAAWKAYLDWAVAAFKLSACGVSDKTQIHTHMCYSEFNDIIQAIADLDADVISIETSRSQMELLDAFTRFRYPNEIGPGVYDIHSPRIPSTEEMEVLMKKAAAVLSARNIWVNPDCGLKTRGWKETETALRHMVQVAHHFRAQHGVAC